METKTGDGSILKINGQSVEKCFHFGFVLHVIKQHFCVNSQSYRVER